MKKILIILFGFLLLFFNSASANMGEMVVGGKFYPAPESMEQMIANVREMSQNNAPRQDMARWMKNVLDGRITNMNSPELIFDRRNLQFWESPMPGSKLFDDWRAQNIYDNETSAQWAWNNQMGNCEEHANIVYYILKKAGVKEKIRMLASGKHAFTVWGLREGADLNNPSTWGPDAIIVDSWMGYVLGPDDAMNHRYYKNGEMKTTLSDQTYNFDKDAPRWDTSQENKSPNSTSSDPCFVATAAFGTALALEIQVLRDFRDNKMRKTLAGRSFIKWYEVNGPKLAQWLNRNPGLKPVVRSWFLRPLVYFIKNLES